MPIAAETERDPKPPLATAIFAIASGAALLTGTALSIASVSQDDGLTARDLRHGSGVAFGSALVLAAGAMLAYVIESSPLEHASVSATRDSASPIQALPHASLTLSKPR